MTDIRKAAEQALALLTAPADTPTDGDYVRAADALRAALAAEQPQPEAPIGWRMVPVEPTKAMLAAGDKIMDCDPLWIARGYRAMIAAAPPPPAAAPTDAHDAARYRWLRDHRGGGHAVVNGDLLEGSELDENIDAALRAAAAARGK